MARLVSIVMAYTKPTQLESDILPALEEEFHMPIRATIVAKMGGMHVCVFDLCVSDTFSLHKTERHLRTAIPGTEVSLLVRFHDTWWRRYRWNVAITVGGGLVVILVVELMRSSATRLYDLFR